MSPRIPRDRDAYVDKHAVPEETWDEPATGRVDITPEELRRIRQRRPTPERLDKLETKHDELGKEVSTIRTDVAHMKGRVETLVEYAAKAEAERERRAAADVAAEERRRKHVIALIGALGAAIAGIVTALAVAS